MLYMCICVYTHRVCKTYTLDLCYVNVFRVCTVNYPGDIRPLGNKEVLLRLQ